MFKKSVMIAVVGVALGLSSATHAFLVDNFTANQNLYADSSPTWDSSGVALTNPTNTDISGAFRNVWLGAAGATTSTNGASTDIFDGTWGQSNADGVTSHIIMQWTGASAPPTGQDVNNNPTATPALTGFSAIDLTDGLLSDYFVFDVISKDANDYLFSITVYEGASFVTYTGDAGAAAISNQRFYIPFSAFASGSATSANFDGATAIVLDIRASASADFTIDNFGTAPEPATLALFGLGLAGLGARTRRRRQA